MLVKGYSFSEVYRNGEHHMNENAIKYDGDKLELFKNENGNIEYQTIDNEDLLRFIGHADAPLVKRLKDDFKMKKSKRHHTRKHHKKHHKSRKHTSIPKSAKKYFRRYKTPHKHHSHKKHKSATKKRSKRRITPAIMKTIY